TPTANAESANFTIIATPTINDIQSNTSDGDLSVYNGQIVRTSGIITFSGNGEYVIQDGDGSWNGIYVYDFNFDMTSVEGDSVTIQATVATFNGVTQLATVTSLAVNNSGNLLPTISTITTNQLTEEYEGVLVKIVNAQVTNATVASGVFEINDGSGALNVDDNLFGDAEVGITNGLDLTITGIGHYNNAFQLLPRYAADMVSATDTVGSTVYTVDQGALTITGMPFSTDLATFEGNITPAAGATWDVFDANGTDIATVLDDTKLLIVVAADGITSSTYTITRNAALTDATVSSTEYTVDNVAETITGVPNGTDLPTFKSNIIAPTYGSFEVYETGGSVVATDLQTGYILRGTAEDGSTTKDYTITVIAIVMDADSYVDAPTTQVAAATLAVVDGDETAEAFDVFSFDITDAGTTDGEPTMVTQVVLFYGPNMTLDFENEIDSGYLVIDGNPIDLSGEPVFGVDSIVFPIADGEIVVPDGSSVNAVVKLILNTTVADGKVIQFFIDANQHGFEAKGSGSGFAADFGTDVVGNDITIDVVATELNFSTEPTDVYIDNNITPAVVVEAIDANGNVDIDYVTDITITATGATLVGTPVTVTPTAGIATFDALSFSDEGTGVTLIAASGTLTNAVSIAFDVTVEPVKELFFSEYIEGDGGNNKALEIYNATGTDVDLHDYVIRINGNGSAWTSFMDFPVGTTIANGDVYVIAHSASNAEILAVTDSIVLDPYGGGTSFVVVFNGNDARALCKVEGSDTTIIDIIGEESVDSLWSVAGTESATQNHTLLRKQGTTIGNANWTSSAGTNTTDSEWIVMDANYFDDLGSFGPKTGTDILEYSFALQTEPATIDDVNHTVDIEVALGTSLTNLVATFTLSDGATAKIGAVVQESGITANDFSSEVIYTVTAEDASAQDWAVNVTVATTQSSAKDITSFTVEGIVGDATIGDGTVSATVEFGTDITSLKPVFDISDLASIADTSAARDFTNPQTYVVTAEDGTTKDWVVTITEESGIEVANIAALRALYTSSNENIYNITGEVTFTHTTSPYFYIQDGTAAILIYNGNSAITSSYSIGDNVSDLVGTFATFGGNMQFELIEDPGTAISSGNTIAPQVVTIPDFTTNYTDYDAELIKLEDVTFSETGNFAAGSNYTLNNGNDNVALRTNFSGADYIGTAIPAQTLDVTAIAGVYNGTPQVYPRALADMVVVTGINDPASFVSVHVYPNPSNGQFNIELNAQKAGNFDLEIINVLGQVIYQKQITQDGTHKDMIDISDKAKGLYYIRITDGTSTKVQKLMIK
ncbi:MAG: T9SS type A sorting domain-containing protein, partial [Bacteroidales bacterium]